MRRFPVATLVAVLSLAAGIGATTVTLTVRNAVFRNAPPLYRDPDQLSRVRIARLDRARFAGAVPATLYVTWRAALGPSIAASTQTRAANDVRADARTDTAPVRAVSPEFFSVLGVAAALGDSNLAPTDGRDGTTPVVLSHGVWQRLFDRRPDVLGRNLWIDDRPHTVVGVMPERFWFSEMNSPVWTPLDLRTLSPEEGLDVIARRPAGTTPTSLEAQLGSAATDYVSRLPSDQRQIRVGVSGAEGTPIGNQVALVLPYLLGASVLLTLLIACANVAILMIAQWTTREHEIAIRASIGASRSRIVKSLVTESVIVSLSGAILGVCTTFALLGLIRRNAAGVGFFDLSVDSTVLAQTAAIALLTGIGVGIMPALSETRRLQANPLRAMAGAERTHQRWRDMLVVFEVMVTVALLVVTSSMIEGYQRLRTTEMGFATQPLMAARVINQRGVSAEQTLEALGRVPGVAEVAAATAVPYAGSGASVRVSVDGAGSNAVGGRQVAISPGFFSTLGARMRAGRAFTMRDSATTGTAIVNEAMALRLFHTADAVDERIWVGTTVYDIVGVVANYSNNASRPRGQDLDVFVPLPGSSKQLTELSVLVRASGSPEKLIETVRREIRRTAPGTEVRSTFTFDQMRRLIGQEILVGTAPLFPLITIGMLLTAAGIYGVLAFAISRRARELAVRIAIGASGRDLVRLVSAHTARLVGLGSTLGIAVTFGLSRLVRAGGGGGSLYDPPLSAFIAPVLIILAVSVAATWIPARRALKIDPARVLRTI